MLVTFCPVRCTGQFAKTERLAIIHIFMGRLSALLSVHRGASGFFGKKRLMTV
jgi:hypothetical protein